LINNIKGNFQIDVVSITLVYLSLTATRGPRENFEWVFKCKAVAYFGVLMF